MASPTDNYNPVPSANPSTEQPGGYLNVRATPESFGARVGEGIQQLGQGAQKGGDELFQAGIRQLQYRNDIAANEGSMSYADYVAQKDTQFRQLKGRNMLDAWPAFQQDLHTQLQKSAENMPSPMAKSQFLRDARSFYDRSVYNLGNVVADTAYHTTVNSYEGKLNTINNFATLHSDDPKALQDGIHQTVETTLLLAQTQGLDPVRDRDAVNAGIQTRVGDLTAGVILQQANTGTTVPERLASIEKAQVTLDQLKSQIIPGTKDAPVLDAKHVDQLQQELTNRRFYMQGRQNKATVAQYSMDAVKSANEEYQNLASTTPTSFSEQNAQLNVDRLFPGAVITSEARTPEHNKAVGGVPDSMHTTGQAIDFKLPSGVTPQEAYNQLKAAGYPVTEFFPEKDGKVLPLTATNFDHIHWGWRPKGGSVPYNVTSQAPNQADWIQANKPRIISDTISQFKRDNPELANDPVAVADLETKVTTNLTRQETMLRQQYKSDSNDIFSYLMGNNTNKQIITDPLALDNDSNIAPVWARFKQTDPTKAFNIEQKLITANAHGQAMGYGTDFWKEFGKVADGEVTDPFSLVNTIGWNKDAPLTNTGLSILDSMITRGSDPTGQSVNKSLYENLQRLRTNITGTDIRPGVKDPEGDKLWDSWLQRAMPRIEKGLQEGQTLGQMFDPKSKEYIGNDLPIRDTQKVMKQYMNQTTDAVGSTYGPSASTTTQSQTNTNTTPKDFNSREDLAKAYSSGKIDANRVKEEAKKHPDWFAPETPTASFK